MNGKIKYLLLMLAFGAIATGSFTANCIDIYQQNEGLFAFSIAVMVGMFLMGVIINECYVIPRLLLRQHYIKSWISIFLMSVVLVASSYFVEIEVRICLGLPQRIKNLTSPWLIIGSAASCILLQLMFIGQCLECLLRIWRKEAMMEEKLTVSLRHYMNEIEQRLQPGTILLMLREISESIEGCKETVNKKILSLSNYLREQLYRLPTPPPVNNIELRAHNKFSNYLVQKKWRRYRHLLFQLTLIVVGLDVFFDAPDHPSFTIDNFFGFLGEILCLEILTFINMHWIFRMFKRNKNLRKYLRNVGILISICIFPIIILQIATYGRNVYTHTVPLGLTLMTTIGTMVTLSMFLGGVSALMLLKYWVGGERRLVLLNAEIARQEYSFLKKQINPHFLFNVLNNLEIQSVDKPEEAIEMVSELERLIEFQFTEANQKITTLEREINFLKSYLALEKTRRDGLSYEINAEVNMKLVKVPTLLFIPFVENAVKYSITVAGNKIIKIWFKVKDDRVEFKCINTFRKYPSPLRKKDSGLGISNTVRRLNLLYGTDYIFERFKKGDCYEVNLEIPI